MEIEPEIAREDPQGGLRCPDCGDPLDLRAREVLAQFSAGNPRAGVKTFVVYCGGCGKIMTVLPGVR